MLFFKKKLIPLFIITILIAQVPFSTNTSASEINNYVSIADDEYEIAYQYMLLESYLNEIGLSMEDLLATNIDFTTIEDDYNPSQFMQSFNLQNFSGNSSNILNLTKSFTVKKYGPNASNTDFMKTFLLYYVDVNESDVNAGRVWGNLPRSYYPDYMTDEDDRVYEAFINSRTGKKMVEMFQSATNAATAISSRLSPENLNEKVIETKTILDTLEDRVDIESVADAIESYAEFESIQTPEGFINDILEIIEQQDSFNETEKEVTKSLVENILLITISSLAGIPGVGIYSIVSMYHATTIAFALDLYDKAALNSLAYSRSTRLANRFANYYGMY